ncbi:MAG TPA: alternative ribosome rescue aminoacyl-tRNA hydrolase ArfB [Caulobacteraceae bacterium]|nr:alternative ribosome rescue aminoacyl-tRNA hydrolase ArfB [Caulobacteraceae bacterium]
MIALGDGLSVDEAELEERFILASGPGGQNVNKVASAVQLRFDARRSPSLPAAVRLRLERLAGGRLTNEGVIVITAARFASQERNRADARQRLAELIRRAAVAPKVRRPTRPTAAARRERMEAKARRAGVKAKRSRPKLED